MNITDDEWKQLFVLLDDYLELSALERPAFLTRLTHQSPHLKEMLESLIAQSDGLDADSLDMSPLPQIDAAVLAVSERFKEFAGLAVGVEVGPYRLMREIGRGGTSTVWLAVRSDGQMRRAIALKLPHLYIHRAQFTERFVRERDILSTLTHPNIARLYDAGISAQGQPYLAMEYHEGTQIIEYCVSRRLRIKERIRLFLQVLEAVQFAHAQLVIHRDIKPSNILVNAQGQVSLLDFGIAKLTVDGETHETELTQFGGRALTPDYASPEQILGRPLGTASDVYSLGVVFYELAAGVRPYRLKRDSRGALEEAILTAEPSRPGHIVTPAQAYACNTTLPRLMRLLRGDIDTIALKALKKSPTERYTTVYAFREDLERFLSGLPILARRDNAWYRARKFVARNKVAVVAGLLVVLALTGGLTIVTWQARRTAVQAQIANTEAATAKAVQDFLEDIFKANSGEQNDPIKGRQTTARQLLDIGAKKIDRALVDAPAAKLSVLATLADMYQDLGLLDESATLRRRGVQVARATYPANDSRIAQALIELAGSLQSSQAVGERDAALVEAGNILDFNRDFSSPVRARLLKALSFEYYDRDQAKALGYAQQSMQIMRRYPASDDMRDALVSLAVMYGFVGDAARAEATYGEALTVSQRVHPGADSGRPQIYSYLGDAQLDLHKFAEAEASYRAAVQAARQSGDESALDAIRAEHGLGMYLFTIGKTREAIDLMSSTKDRVLQTRGLEDSLITPWILTGYGRALTRFGRIEEGLEYLQLAERNQRKYRPGAMVLALVLERKALSLSEFGDYDEAVRELDEAEAIHRAIHDEGSQLNDHVMTRTYVLLAADKAHDARATLDKFIAPTLPDGGWSETALRLSIARAELELLDGNAQGALQFVAAARSQLSKGNFAAFFLLEQAQLVGIEGRALAVAHRPYDAQSILLQSVLLDQQLLDSSSSPVLASSELALASCLLDIGKRDEARQWLHKADDILSKHARLGARYTKPLRALKTLLLQGRKALRSVPATAKGHTESRLSTRTT
jgi:eukaryotic-like serine/threonine-protein kinase